MSIRVAVVVALLLSGCFGVEENSAGLKAAPVPPAWTHKAYGASGYDYPTITYWDGRGFNPRGTTPDSRSQRPTSPGYFATQYNCYAQEISVRGTGSVAYAEHELRAAVDNWSEAAEATPVHFYNEWSKVVSDGSSNAIQILPAVVTGKPALGKAYDCDGLKPSADRGHGLFSIAFPPGYDRTRGERYPVLLVHPGMGATPPDILFKSNSTIARTLAGILKESVENGGRGVIVIIGNAGGQGSTGMNSEYATALNHALGTLARDANADRSQVVLYGGSRGGTNALFHGSRPSRNYRAVAAFAIVPITHLGSLLRVRLNLLPLHGNYTMALCYLNPSTCQDAWMFDYVPAPGQAPAYAAQTLVASVNPARVNDASPWGHRNGWDPGAWVEICAGPRDYVSGGGTATEYFDALPGNVDKRLNYIINSAHGGNDTLCRDHMKSYVLDKLAGNSAYAFDTSITGPFYYRLDPADAVLGLSGTAQLKPLTMGSCGNRPPILLLPRIQQHRTSDMVVEPSNFIVNGQAGRKYRVDLLDAPGSSTVIASWSGTLGEMLPAACKHFPRANSTEGARCDFAREVLGCVGSVGLGPVQASCGFRFHYDCDGDGTVEPIGDDNTPFDPQGPAELWVTNEQCNGFKACRFPPLGRALAPYDGMPMSITPCLNLANQQCLP